MVYIAPPERPRFFEDPAIRPVEPWDVIDDVEHIRSESPEALDSVVAQGASCLVYNALKVMVTMDDVVGVFPKSYVNGRAFRKNEAPEDLRTKFFESFGADDRVRALKVNKSNPLPSHYRIAIFPDDEKSKDLLALEATVDELIVRLGALELRKMPFRGFMEGIGQLATVGLRVNDPETKLLIFGHPNVVHENGRVSVLSTAFTLPTPR